MAVPRLSIRDMVINAFKDIPGRAGLTRDTINEYVKSKYECDEDCYVDVKRALKDLVKQGLVLEDDDTKRYFVTENRLPAHLFRITSSKDSPTEENITS